MQALMSRVEQLRRGLALVAAYAVVAGGLSIGLALSALADGESYGVARAAIGVVGIGAGLLTLSGRTLGLGLDGWRALVLWAALQTPVVAGTEGGNLFRQLVDAPIGTTSSRSVNGGVVEYSQLGVNLVGLVLLIVLVRLRERWDLSQRARAKALAPA